jgi:hypothetical protein
VPLDNRDDKSNFYKNLYLQELKSGHKDKIEEKEKELIEL